MNPYDDIEELEGPFEQTPGATSTEGSSGSSDNPPLPPVESIDTQDKVITLLPAIDRSFFHSLVDGLGTADTPVADLEPASGDGDDEREPGYVSKYNPPSNIPAKYKFKLRIATALWNNPTSTVNLQGLDGNGSETEQIDVEMEEKDDYYVSKKPICAIEGGAVDSQVTSEYSDLIFFDPPHFKVKIEKPGQPGEKLELIDKATTMVFPAVRWKKSGDWSVLTDAYSNGKVQVEPTSGAIAFDYDHQIEMFAVVRIYDIKEKKLRYFCDAPDKPASLSVVEERKGARKSVPLEALSASPEKLKETVNWFGINPDIHRSLENDWNANTEAEKWASLEYAAEEIQGASGQWKISVGGDSHKGVNRYQVEYGCAESPGAQFRQNTREDHRISDLVMRIIIKGDYPTEYLRWASTFINVPFVDGSNPRQVDEYIAIDCADICLISWIRAGHSVSDFANQSAQSIVSRAQAGTYTMVLAPTAIYPESDTDAAHKKWSQISRPQPGDLIMWDWPGVKGATFDHATIYAGTDGPGNTLAADGSDHTIYAGSRSFQYRVRSAAFNGIGGDPGLWDRIQSAPGQNPNLPVRISIIRLK